MREKAERRTRQQEFARSHPTRANILALVAQDGSRSLDPNDLSRELPNEKAVVVNYHLQVLRSASLLPLQVEGGSEGSTS